MGAEVWRCGRLLGSLYPGREGVCLASVGRQPSCGAENLKDWTFRQESRRLEALRVGALDAAELLRVGTLDAAELLLADEGLAADASAVVGRDTAELLAEAAELLAVAANAAVEAAELLAVAAELLAEAAELAREAAGAGAGAGLGLGSGLLSRLLLLGLGLEGGELGALAAGLRAAAELLAEAAELLAEAAEAAVEAAELLDTAELLGAVEAADGTAEGGAVEAVAADRGDRSLGVGGRGGLGRRGVWDEKGKNAGRLAPKNFPDKRAVRMPARARLPSRRPDGQALARQVCTSVVCTSARSVQAGPGAPRRPAARRTK